MTNKLCIPEKEVEDIIKQLQKETPTLMREEILKAIKSCCLHKSTLETPKDFFDCVKERVRQLKKYP